MLFCHRWLLLCFKREFPEAEALRIWEACWAHYQVSKGPQQPHSTLPLGVPCPCRMPTANASPQLMYGPLWPASALASPVTEIDADCPLTVLITTLWG